MSPAVALVPSTACEEIESAPSLIAAQFDPSEPLGRLKSSRPPEPGLTLLQVTATFVTSAAAIVPVPFATLQVWPLGFVLTVTL